MAPSRQTRSSYGPPYPLGRWSLEMQPREPGTTYQKKQNKANETGQNQIKMKREKAKEETKSVLTLLQYRKNDPNTVCKYSTG